MTPLRESREKRDLLLSRVSQAGVQWEKSGDKKTGSVRWHLVFPFRVGKSMPRE